MSADMGIKKRVPLSDGRMGKSYRVLESNVEERIESRLEALGINDDTVIQIINKKRCGTMIIKVGNQICSGKQNIKRHSRGGIAG